MWVIVACPSLNAQGKAIPSLESDFEETTSSDGWNVATGTDLPARGALGVGAGHSGRGAVLQYEFFCDTAARCGGSVRAVWRPGPTLAVSRRTTISLWIRFASNVAVLIQCRDADGRTTDFPIPVATLEQPRAGEWQRVVIPLSDGPQPVKGRLAEIGIVVQGRTAGAGALSFDQLRIEDMGEVFELHADAAVEPPIAGAAVQAGRLGVNIHVLNDNHVLNRARAAGFSFVRMDMFWHDVERGGRYNFFGYDALLGALDARGMGALWILDYGHPDHGGDVPRTTQDVAAFARFAAAAAAHFRGRNVRYEIWNEPNLAHFWKPAPNATEYSALLRAAVAAMRAVDPAAVISSGGLSRFDGAFLSEMLDAGLASQLNAIAVHPYRDSAPESVAGEWALVTEWARRAFGAKPEIWNTEWGYSSVDLSRDPPRNGHGSETRKRQAVLAVREVLTVWILGMPLAVWYDLRDDGPDGMDAEKNYGLLDVKGKDKPAMKALLTLLDAAKNRMFAGMVRDTPAGIHALRLDGAADTVMVVWSDRPGVKQTVATPKTGLLSATTLTGETLKTKEKPVGVIQWVLEDTQGPVYLKWERRPSSVNQ